MSFYILTAYLNALLDVFTYILKGCFTALGQSYDYPMAGKLSNPEEMTV